MVGIYALTQNKMTKKCTLVQTESHCRRQNKFDRNDGKCTFVSETIHDLVRNGEK